MNKSQAVAIYQTRLPLPARMDAEFWQILCEVIFPTTNDPRSIVLAVAYCNKRNLDILKRPVNIVPMWNASLRKEVDTIWPSINETQITAARTGEWVGLDPPVLGEMVTQTFTGRRKDKDGGWSDASVTVTFPRWASVTVYRLKHGVRCAFTGDPPYWLEAYGRIAGGVLPNGTWQKRPIGQLIKVAKAAALRAAFPEEGTGPTDDEMGGGILQDELPETVERTPIAQATTAPVDDEILDPAPMGKTTDESWREWGARFIARVRAASDEAIVDAWMASNKDSLDAMEKAEPKIHANLMHSINKHRLTLVDETAAVE
jgi:phage recombination protein Bet